MQAINDAADQFEASALAYKVIAAAEIMKSDLFETGDFEQTTFGAIDQVGNSGVRSDLFIVEKNGRGTVARFLYEGERMAPGEYVYLSNFLAATNLARVIIVHQSQMFQQDEAMMNKIEQLFPGRVVFRQQGIPQK